MLLSKLTIMSHEAKKKQFVGSVLFTWSTTLKFVNARCHLSLVIKDSACSNYIELVTQQWRKSVPEYQPLRVSWHLFTCAHAKKPILLASIHLLFTKQIVPSLYQKLLTQTLLKSFYQFFVCGL